MGRARTLLYVFTAFKHNREVSYTCHAFGGLAGLLVGVILLENRKVTLITKKPEVSQQRTLQVDQWEKMAKPIAFGTFYALMVSLVLWHVIGTYTSWGFPIPEEQLKLEEHCNITYQRGGPDTSVQQQ